jgi:DNA-directed RNA polymerase specialized sigma24 family protein
MTANEVEALREIEERLRARTYREIAAELRLAHGTVQNIERRALEKMRKRAKGWEP